MSRLNEGNINSSMPDGYHLPGGSRELQQHETTAQNLQQRYKDADYENDRIREYVNCDNLYISNHARPQHTT